MATDKMLLAVNVKLHVGTDTVMMIVEILPRFVNKEGAASQVVQQRSSLTYELLKHVPNEHAVTVITWVPSIAAR